MNWGFENEFRHKSKVRPHFVELSSNHLEFSSKEAALLSSTPHLRALLVAFAPAFTAPSFENFCVVALGAILAQGRRTITEIIRAAGDLAATRHFTTYHRFLSRATWNALTLAQVLAHQVLLLLPVDAPVLLAVDDTTERRWGPKVHGKGCHRDAIRSSQKRVIHCFGHKWVVLAVLVKFPFCANPWALPIAAMLYRSVKADQAEGKRHRTLCDWARSMLSLTRRWFPRRKFVVLGDGGYSSVRFANQCKALAMTLVGKIRKDTVLYDPPPPRRKGQRGRPRKKGERLPSPSQVAANEETNWTEGEVQWYGGKRKRVRWTTGVGHRHAPHEELIEVRWVYVQDPSGRTRDECFFSTDITMDPRAIVELYVARWPLETTFEETRAHLGLETSRNWCRSSVERTVPCLLGLFSLIAVWYFRYHNGNPPPPAQDPWYEKPHPTFSDAIVALRQHLWAIRIFIKSDPNEYSRKIDTRFLGYIAQRLGRSA